MAREDFKQAEFRGTRVTSAIPFVDLAAQRRRLAGSVDQAIARVLEHGQFVLGPEVAELEGQLARRSGVARAVTCASGTDALQLVLMAWGIGPGDAVIVPGFTFVATAEVVALVGATPVFADVDERDGNLDAGQISLAAETARRSGLTPRAVIAVGLYGQPCDEASIETAAADEGLLVLGDAAQSYGGTFERRDTAAFGDATATSFFPAKPLGCYGDGGAVFTDDQDLANAIESLRMHGFGAERYEHVRVGLTGRLDTIQAAVLIEKLRIFDEELQNRQRIADRYGESLSDVVDVPRLLPGRTSAWAQYTVRVDERDAVAAHLSDRGVPTAIHYPVPLHRQPAYRSYPVAGGDLRVAERMSSTVLSLPMHPYLSAEVQDGICAELCSVGARS